ncbi:PH domain-containing protein [Psychroserpens sp. BH13MA-6]
MGTTDFSQPLRQSSKGIIIIFAFNTFKFLKRFFVAFLAIGFSLMKKKTFGSLSVTTLLLILFGILIIILVIAILKYLNFKFHVNDEDFHLSTGIITKDHTIIPKSKIQNIYIKQNFLQQLIQVVSLNIETAGDKKSEIEINALDKSTALQLKQRLFDKTKKVSQVEEDVSNSDQVFFKVSPKRLILEGISQNHLRSFAVIASFVFGLYYEFKDYFSDLNLRSWLESLLQFEEESFLNLVLANVILVGLMLFGSLLFSVIKTVVVNFNLEVIENKKTIEINKGLFNKVSLSLTPSRIQNLVVKTNRVKRYFGLHTLSVKQAMVNVKQRKNFVVIALEKLQLHHLIEKLLDHYTLGPEILKPQGFYKRVLAFRIIFLAAVIHMPGLLVFGASFLWLNLLWLPIIGLYIHYGYKKAYYSISSDFITVGSGIIDTTTNILEISKIQAVKLQQNIFQKQRQIASVSIATASKTVVIPYISQLDAENIHDFLIYQVESQAKDWM